MLIFGLKTCDTCRKAIKALPEAEFRDVRADGIPAETLEEAHAALGDALVNRRSTSWRGLSEAERAMPAPALIASHPTVMKRPLISVDGRYFIGWNKQLEGEVKALL